MSAKSWALALLPLALLALLLAWIVRSGPTEALREGVPPVELLAIPRAVLAPAACAFRARTICWRSAIA